MQKAAGAVIQKRPRLNEEMSKALRGGDKPLARLALWSFQFFPEPPAAVAPAVASFGDNIIASLRVLSQDDGAAQPAARPSDEITADYLDEAAGTEESSAGEKDRETVAGELSLEFSDWMVAVRALQERANVSFMPQVQEIAMLARMCPDDYNIRMTVLRVVSFYLNKWAGIAPLPGDPPPR